MGVIHAKLLAYREDVGDYIIYAFENLTDGTYEICTRLPRWESPILKVGDIGFLKYKEVVAGEDTWYDWTTGRHVPYKQPGVYFIDFVCEKPVEDLTL
jgi:hypothetical protein